MSGRDQKLENHLDEGAASHTGMHGTLNRRSDSTNGPNTRKASQSQLLEVGGAGVMHSEVASEGAASVQFGISCPILTAQHWGSQLSFDIIADECSLGNSLRREWRLGGLACLSSFIFSRIFLKLTEIKNYIIRLWWFG